ncbi:hypothetical protein HMPREF0262_01113 [Clostridium sp. ATCC 29733]|nr:hypothetical protein HMPREF0262_01113 [Clostridium sp. ATCC 29733]
MRWGKAAPPSAFLGAVSAHKKTIWSTAGKREKTKTRFGACDEFFDYFL